MNEHVIPMFRITRAEVLAKLQERIDSFAEARANVETVQAESVNRLIEKHRVGLEKARESLDEAEEATRYMRDHLDEKDHWLVSAQQLVEIKTQCAPVKLTVEMLRFTIDPERDAAVAMYNQQGRRLRT